MGRRRVQVEPVLLGVLTVAALVAGEAEDALLEDRVSPVPERQRETQRLPIVANAGEPVLVPSIRSRTCMLVRKELPRASVLAVVLAHGPPCPLAEVGSPPPPRRAALRDLLETRLLA